MERLGLGGFPDGDPAARSLEWGVRVLNVPCTYRFDGSRRRRPRDGRLLPRLRRRRWPAGGAHARSRLDPPGSTPKGDAMERGGWAGRTSSCQRDRAGHMGVRRPLGRGRRRRRRWRPATRRIDAGVNWIDTADIYGQGRAERIVGRAVRERREEVIVATKGGVAWETRARPSASGARRRPTTCGWPATAASRPSAWTTSTSTRCTGRWAGVPAEETIGALLELRDAGQDPRDRRLQLPPARPRGRRRRRAASTRTSRATT